MAGFRWSGRREQAARLVADDTLTNEQIAAACGVTRQALDAWKRHSDFRARVASIVAEIRARILQEGIAIKEHRIRALNARHRALERVIAERATDPGMGEVPGGTTGLLVRQAKLVKVYESNGDPDEDDDGETLHSAKRDVLVYEYAVDTGLLKELRDHEKQVAQELGQWIEKGELTGRNGGPIAIDDARETLTTRLAALAARQRADNPDSEPAPSGSGSTPA